MTKKKVPKRTYVAEIDLKTIFAELVPAKKKGRPPKQVGQGRNRKHIRLHGVTQDELKKRLDAAVKILEKGVPKAPSTPVEKKKDNPEKVKYFQKYLNDNGVKFNKQLGEKKLQALVDEHEASKPQPPPE